MRAAVLALALLAVPAVAQNAQPTVVGEIKALQAEVATLRADRDALKTRVNVLENSYNIALYYALGHLCYANAMQATWVGALTGLKPFPLGDAQCPPAGETIYVPGFIGGQQAVLKPPQ